MVIQPKLSMHMKRLNYLLLKNIWPEINIRTMDDSQAHCPAQSSQSGSQKQLKQEKKLCRMLQETEADSTHLVEH